tara:strand:- start:80 stop:610 length:531 start_codon:yes stop_codon:yes gene_type:complete
MKKNLIFLTLLIFFSIIFIILYSGLERVKTYSPEKITNKNIIKFSAKDLFSENKVDFNNLVLSNKLTVINIWASWCKPCREEHSYLMKIGNEKNINLIGINYKDNLNNSKKFIDNFGNPFSRILVDKNGIISINIGAYGVPETYIINSEKKILKKYIGPLKEKNVEEIIRLANEIN